MCPLPLRERASPALPRTQSGEGYLSASDAAGDIPLTQPSLLRVPTCPLPQGERTNSQAPASRLALGGVHSALCPPYAARMPTPSERKCGHPCGEGWPPVISSGGVSGRADAVTRLLDVAGDRKSTRL